LLEVDDLPCDYHRWSVYVESVGGKVVLVCEGGKRKNLEMTIWGAGSDKEKEGRGGKDV
jgi:hypothetical protein